MRHALQSPHRHAGRAAPASSASWATALKNPWRRHAAKDEPLAALGLLVAPALVGKAVDATVTPETLAEVVRTARAPDPRKSALPPPDDAADTPKAERVKAHLAMTGLNSFDIRLSPADQPEQRLTLVLHQAGPVRLEGHRRGAAELACLVGYGARGRLQAGRIAKVDVVHLLLRPGVDRRLDRPGHSSGLGLRPRRRRKQ